MARPTMPILWSNWPSYRWLLSSYHFETSLGLEVLKSGFSWPLIARAKVLGLPLLTKDSIVAIETLCLRWSTKTTILSLRRSQWHRYHDSTGVIRCVAQIRRAPTACTVIEQVFVSNEVRGLATELRVVPSLISLIQGASTIAQTSLRACIRDIILILWSWLLLNWLQ